MRGLLIVCVGVRRVRGSLRGGLLLFDLRVWLHFTFVFEWEGLVDYGVAWQWRSQCQSRASQL